MTDPMKTRRTPRFEPGDRVRVRYGVTAPDFEDIPLGGWTGVVTGVEQVDDLIDYEVEWDRRTLDGMHPVYRKRCERDDLDVETMCLTEEDIEPDDGTHVPIEQPTGIKTPPLSERDEDDRVRRALGLTHDDPIPGISHETLGAYYRYLTGHLKFPFTAYCGEEEIGPYSRKRATMTVTGLIDPDGDVVGLEDGLFCTGRDRGNEFEVPLCEIEVKKKDPNSKPVSDYAYWFHNWPSQDEIDTDQEEFDEFEESEIPRPTLGLFIKAILVCGVGGGVLGVTAGAALGTIKWAGPAAMIGGIPLAIVGALVLGRYGSLVGAVKRLRFVSLLGAVLGLVGGGLIGAYAGLVLVTLPWSLFGLVAGILVGPFVISQKRRRSVSFRATFLGTCAGVLVATFRHDQTQATSGAISGLITGLLAGAGLVLLSVAAVYLTAAGPTRHEEGDEEPDESREGEEDEDHDDGGGGLRLR